jgi:hypothetical protein
MLRSSRAKDHASKHFLNRLSPHNAGLSLGRAVNKELADLVANAKAVSFGMVRVAATKPNDHPLESNAQTFRGTATMLHALSEEVTRSTARAEALEEKVRRIATLQVRGGAEAVEQGDWKALVDELQALAQEALVPGSSGLSRREPKPRQDIPRRPAA